MASSSESNADDAVDLKRVIEQAEKLAAQIDNGSIDTAQLQTLIPKHIDELAKLTAAVNRLELFSSNETVDDVPTESLRYLLIPCCLGLLHHNHNVQITEKIDELKKAKNLEIVDFSLPTGEADLNETETSDARPTTSSNGEDRRKMKIERFTRQTAMSKAMQNIRMELKRKADDESLARELYLSQLKYWAEKVMDEVESIDAEIPMLRMVVERAKNQGNSVVQPPAPSSQPKSSWKPFILTRDAAQKAVFGQGYPSVATLTVDEWAQQRFGNPTGENGSALNFPAGHNDNADNEDDKDGDEEAEERERQRKIEWDEYKDTHRRGWGNMHNKG
ncbi:hypothetical protein WR25_14726 [Diploscapter pachys]|uniref:Immunoglobulin-binding protein 1 n=1 Tax=Diploscapter pachys TaxID=2018661 RepID=A0A2A2J993_9BILA|nr:hypothetical protein WR25_14726 [Diploscapter pachys]